MSSHTVAYGSEGQIDTFAFLNDGLNGKAEPLTKFWSKITRHFDSSFRKTNLPVKGLYGGDLVVHRKQRPNPVTFEPSRLQSLF